MNTNMTIPRDAKLFGLGQDLFAAAQAYWDEYQQQCGGCAVVWVGAESGEFVLFTRGEYRADLMRVVDNINFGEEPLVRPFEKKEETP